jgi:lipopolysaccharide/colanic/teichoic acid biosynthesis glycosyltransferase
MPTSLTNTHNNSGVIPVLDTDEVPGTRLVINEASTVNLLASTKYEIGKKPTATADSDQHRRDHSMWNNQALTDLRLDKIISNRHLYYFIKRSLDVLFASFVLILIAPVLLAVAVLIKLDSPGPIFFKQQRVGARRRHIDGQWQWQTTAFTMYKFRSMYHGVDSARHREYVQAFINNDQNAMAKQNPESQTSSSKPVYKLTNDSRITRIGHFIRASSIDELPQLFNVLKGDMTLVGPRPALQYEVAMYQPWHHKRLEATPGMTGLWQVSARSAVDFDTMVKLDIEYVETQNLLLDLKILWQTPRAVFSRSGAK